VTWPECQAWMSAQCGQPPYGWSPGADRYAEILWVLCEALAVTNVLEIGIGPTCMSGMVAAHSMHNRGGGHLLSFDIDPSRPEAIYRERAKDLRTDWVQVYGDSLAMLSELTLDRSYDLVYVDGDHDELHAYTDTVNAVNHLRPGGYLLIDDYPGCQGVTDAATRLRAEGFTFVHVPHDLAPSWNGRLLWQKPS